MRLEWSVLSPAWQTSIAVVLAMGGMVSGEARQDTQMLILTKPASRATYVAAMFGIQAGFLVVTTLGAGVIELAVSRLLFPDNPVAPLVATTSAWLVLALVGSVSLGSPLAASGVSLAAMVVMLLLTLREPTERYSPGRPDRAHVPPRCGRDRRAAVAGADGARMRRRRRDPSRRRLPTSRTVTAGSLRGDPQRQHEAYEDGQSAPPGPALGASDAFLSLSGLIHAVRLDGAVRRQNRIKTEPARGPMLPALCGENEPQRHGQQQNPPTQGERQGQTPLPRGVPETRGGQCQDSTGSR